ncbi:hypothetical protein ACFVS2_20035 [Brevibacillus sp. NPDC058079]
MRTDRSVIVTDSVQGEGTAIGSCLKGMLFHHRQKGVGTRV